MPRNQGLEVSPPQPQQPPAGTVDLHEAQRQLHRAVSLGNYDKDVGVLRGGVTVKNSESSFSAGSTASSDSGVSSPGEIREIGLPTAVLKAPKSDHIKCLESAKEQIEGLLKQLVANDLTDVQALERADKSVAEIVNSLDAVSINLRSLVSEITYTQQRPEASAPGEDYYLLMEGNPLYKGPITADEAIKSGLYDVPRSNAEWAPEPPPRPSFLNIVEVDRTPGNRRRAVTFAV